MHKLLVIIMKKLLFIFSFLCLSAVEGYAQKTLTLKDCLEIGIENNLSLESKRKEMQKSKYGVSENRARLLPQINGFANYNDNIDPPVSVTDGSAYGNPYNITYTLRNSANAGLQLQMPLYNQTLYTTVSIAKTMDEISRLSYEKVREDLILEICKMYYLGQTTAEQVTLIKANITRLEELKNITVAFHDNGMAMEVDVKRVNINLENLKVQYDNVLAMQEQQLNLLKYIMDYPAEEQIALVPVNSENITPVELTGLSENLYELQLLQSQRVMAEKQKKMIGHGYIPSLNLTANWMFSAYTDKAYRWFHSGPSNHWFRSYGLGLSQRELQEFAGVDMGNIYHDALWHFAERIRRSSYTWYDLPEQTREAWIEESMNDAIAGCANVGAFDEAKNRYLLSRMKDTIRRTVWALTIQVQKGRFTPSDFEVSFSQADHLEAIRFQLTEEEKMRLRGRIDRVDTCETDDKVYVKIIDYKSGNTTFSLLNLYHGLQLQLVVYMNAALELEAKKHPGKRAVPAGMFYYHIEDPMVDGSGTESEEEIRQAVLEELKPNGLVNDDPEIYGAMDTELSGSSAVIPVALKADGSLKATSKTASTEEFETMSDYVKETVTKAGRRILGGDVAAAPYELDGRSGCDYCPYHMVCGFDARIPGFSYRKLEKPDGAEAILAKMRETRSEEKRQ